MTEQVVRLAVHDGVGTVTLDSPHNRNALSAQLRAQLLRQLRAARDDDAVRVVVLSHTGSVFCAGADLKEGPAAPESLRDFPDALETIWTSPKPVVARVAGPARAGGLGLIAACDIAIGCDDLSFALTEVRIGVVAAIISVPLLPRLRPRAEHELFLTGETFDAARAVEIGLLNRAVPADRLDVEVERYTDMLLLGAPEAQAATKQMLRAQRPAALGEQFDQMLALSGRHFASEEGQEGIMAFREKRPPSWAPPQTS